MIQRDRAADHRSKMAGNSQKPHPDSSGAVLYFETVAERVGFEPTVPVKDTTVFKTAALNHSTTSPDCGGTMAGCLSIRACRRSKSIVAQVNREDQLSVAAVFAFRPLKIGLSRRFAPHSPYRGAALSE